MISTQHEYYDVRVVNSCKMAGIPIKIAGGEIILLMMDYLRCLRNKNCATCA